MTTSEQPAWLLWAREIQSLSQTGLTFSRDDYDTQRYQRLIEIAADMVAQNTAFSNSELLDNFMLHPGYATPKVDVRGAALRDNKILLVKERSDGNWCMPGGWADVGERPSETVAREVREESGFTVLPRKVIGVFDANRSGRPLAFFHAFKIVFLCDIIDGEAMSSDETSAVGFFDLDHLPPLSTNRTNERHLAEIRAHLSDPNRPSAFD